MNEEQKEQFIKDIMRFWTEHKVRLAKMFLENPELGPWDAAKEEAYHFIPFATGTEVEKKKRSLYPIAQNVKRAVLERIYGNFEKETSQLCETGEVLIPKELKRTFMIILNNQSIFYKEPVLIELYKFRKDE